MMLQLVLLPLMLMMAKNHVSEAGSSCPTVDKIYPCFCSIINDASTVLVCPGIRNATQLDEVTKSFKSMLVDRLILLNIFPGKNADADLEVDFVESNDSYFLPSMFPKKWLAVLRVRELEIQGGNLHNCFLCDDALEGQADFLTSLVAKNANLSGHLCSNCGSGSPSYSLSTKELRKTPLLQTFDLSHNGIRQIDGFAFPNNMRSLKKVVLSNNKIVRINDNAFSNLYQLAELDLSRNLISSISSKIFRSAVDTALKVLDLSHNAIRTVPDNMFRNMMGLAEVKLNYNLISVLAEEAWRSLPIKVEKVDLRGNFLVCNCTMKWINKLSKSTKLMAQCISPKDVEFHELKPTLSSLMSCK